MIVWTPNFPRRERPLGYLRLLLARHRYFDHYGIGRANRWRPLTKKPGYQTLLRSWRDKYKDKRCFILGNGPSLQKMHISLLRNEITIGVNYIYTAFPKWGFHTTYLIFEDIEQTELRRHDIPCIKGPVKLAALYNAYAFKACKDTVFMNVRLADGYYWDHLAPMFSTDFAHIVYLGSTVTYLAIQLAYHLGCNPVYLIGVDHNYGELPKRFPPGKITISEENYHLVRGLHFSGNYYKIGDQIGVPNVRYQEEAYTKARKVFEENRRKIFNAGLDSKLKVFEKVSFESLF